MKMSESENVQHKVSMIGLGAMGSAIARAFMGKGQEVVVWNRDKSRVAPLVNEGTTAAGSVADAIRSSPLTVICLTDSETTYNLLQAQEVADALAGKILVSLSSGTPGEVRALAAWIRHREGRCLHGNIMAWPRQMGTDEAMITVCGPEETYRQTQPLLQLLAGTVSYTGADDGASAALCSAAMAYLSANWIGFCYGALLCEAEGLPVDTFGAMMESFAPFLGQEAMRMGKVIRHNDFGNPETTLERTRIDLGIWLRHAQQAGLPTALPELATGLLEQSGRAGYDKEEVAAMIKVLRAASRQV